MNFLSQATVQHYKLRKKKKNKMMDVMLHSSELLSTYARVSH